MVEFYSYILQFLTVEKEMKLSFWFFSTQFANALMPRDLLILAAFNFQTKDPTPNLAQQACLELLQVHC